MLGQRRPVQLVPAVPPAREVSPLALYQAGRLAGLAGVTMPFYRQGEVSPLELYGARLAPDLSGWWVYAFADPDGTVWYAGQSEVLVSRWRDHYYGFGDRFVRADKWLIGVPNEAEADVCELLLIMYYQPECNTKGRREELERRIRMWQRTNDKVGRKRVLLDPSQATR